MFYLALFFSHGRHIAGLKKTKQKQNRISFRLFFFFFLPVGKPKELPFWLLKNKFRLGPGARFERKMMT